MMRFIFGSLLFFAVGLTVNAARVTESASLQPQAELVDKALISASTSLGSLDTSASLVSGNIITVQWTYTPAQSSNLSFALFDSSNNRVATVNTIDRSISNGGSFTWTVIPTATVQTGLSLVFSDSTPQTIVSLNGLTLRPRSLSVQNPPLVVYPRKTILPIVFTHYGDIPRVSITMFPTSGPRAAGPVVTAIASLPTTQDSSNGGICANSCTQTYNYIIPATIALGPYVAIVNETGVGSALALSGRNSINFYFSGASNLSSFNALTIAVMCLMTIFTAKHL